MAAIDHAGCGVNPQTDCEECRPRTIQLRRLEHLEERLRKADIFVRDLAELIWIWLEPVIEERFERIAKEAVRQAFRNLNFQWRLD
jgi:hypothetical protein